MNRKLQLLKYLASDAISALIGWSAFYFYWKHSLQVVPGEVSHLTTLNHQFFLGLLILPFFWLFGINVVVLRMVPILTGACMLILLYVALKEFFNKNAPM